MKYIVAHASLACLALAVSSSACSQTAAAPAADHDGTNVAAASTLIVGAPYDELVGRWQFVYDDARRSAVESQLAAKISDPAELARAKREAEQEAAASEIELTSDRVYVSRIGDKELLRGPVDAAPPGVTLTLRDHRTLVLHDPAKGDLIFTRR